MQLPIALTNESLTPIYDEMLLEMAEVALVKLQADIAAQEAEETALQEALGSRECERLVILDLHAKREKSLRKASKLALVSYLNKTLPNDPPFFVVDQDKSRRSYLESALRLNDIQRDNRLDELEN